MCCLVCWSCESGALCVLEVMYCVLWVLEVVICMLEVLESIRCVSLGMLEVMEGVLYLLDGDHVLCAALYVRGRGPCMLCAGKTYCMLCATSHAGGRGELTLCWICWKSCCMCCRCGVELCAALYAGTVHKRCVKAVEGGLCLLKVAGDHAPYAVLYSGGC